MEDPFVYQLALSALTSALGIAVGWGMQGLRSARERRDDLNERQVRERDENRAAMRLLLGYRLSDVFRRYVVEGQPITTAEKHEVEDIYVHYHAYGGNGEGTRKYREIMSLKVKD